MGVLRRVLAAWVVVAVVLVGVPSSYGTTHYHKTTTRRHKEVDESSSASSIAMPPADSPVGPTVPSDPYPSGPPTVFDVRSYGAVGDGSTDDTAAFQAAWKAACAVEDGVLLIPSDSSFMIRSTIFSGPCQPGFVFQVTPPTSRGKVPAFDISDELGRKLGQGQFGTIYPCIDKATGKEFACKSIAKRKLLTEDDVEDVRREIQIMHHLAGHPNVISIIGAYEDAVTVHLVMERPSTDRGCPPLLLTSAASS